MTTTGPTTKAGWYPDPTTAGRIRYWDGTSWTQHSLEAPPMQAPTWDAPRPMGSTPKPRPWWRRRWAIAIAVVAVLMVLASLSPDSDSNQGAKSPAAALLTPAPTQVVVPKVHHAEVQRVAVPLLTGMSLAQAREELRSQHLFGGYLQRKPSTAQPGTVLSQGLGSGKQVAWRSKVPLVIAVPLPHVPVVSGQSGTAAAAALRNAGFRVRTVHKTVTSGTEGVVLSETPAAGQSVRPGALVTIVVAHVVRPLVSAPAPTQSSSCTPGYSPCLPPASDYDCAGGSGDGPKYTGFVRVTGSDPYDLDSDGDGLACESS
jgi:resuscitation-promoting factor RpfB